MVGKATLTRARLKTPKAAAIAGIAFSLLMSAIIWLLRRSIPADPLEPGAWLATNTQTVALALNLVPFAGVAFLWFIGVIRDRIGTYEDRFFATVLLGSGLLFVAMLFVAAASRGVIGFAVKSPGDNESLPGADTLRYLPQTGYAALGIGGLLAAAVAMATTSWLIVRTAVFGRWLAWLGSATALVIVVAAAALVGMVAIPAMLIWVLAVSVAMWRGQP